MPNNVKAGYWLGGRLIFLPDSSERWFRMIKKYVTKNNLSKEDSLEILSVALAVSSKSKE